MRWRCKGMLRAGAGAVLVLVLALACWLPDEPRHWGLPLTYWLRQGSEPGASLPPKLSMTIAGMGTNAVPSLVRLFRSEDAFPERWLAGVFRARGWGEPPVRMAWQDHLAAAKAFGALGPAGTGAIPELAAMLENLERTHPAAQALAGIGPAAIPALTNALASTNPVVRRGVAVQIRLLDTNAGPAIPALLRCVQDPDTRVATGAMETLAHLRPESDRVLPALVAQFGDPRPAMRSQALLAVAAFEEGAADVLPAVLGRLADPMPGVREKALSAACRIHPAPKEMLRGQLGHADPCVRGMAALGLGRWGRRDPDVFNALTNLLTDGDEFVRERAAVALHAIDGARARRLRVPFPAKPVVTKLAGGGLNPGR